MPEIGTLAIIVFAAQVFVITCVSFCASDECGDCMKDICGYDDESDLIGVPNEDSFDEV